MPTGLPVQMPLIDIQEVGTGGGSIARIEDGGALQVGPQSAGAAPGPVCYGRGGTEPTITDANLVLGRLGADRFLGGEMTLDLAAATAGAAPRGRAPLGLDPVEDAAGILRIADDADGPRRARGDRSSAASTPRDFALVAYGGAGPLHAFGRVRESCRSAPSSFRERRDISPLMECWWRTFAVTL